MLFCMFLYTFVRDMKMQTTIPYTLNVGGTLLSLDKPLVMGILNATEESFYAPSRHTDGAVAERALAMLDEGAAILDVGGCSTKPGLAPVSEEEEMRRLSMALEAIRKVAPKAVISVDTFRASVAERCVKEYGVQIINDVYGGEADERMFDTVAQLRVPYILTHSVGASTPHPSTLSTQTSGNLWQSLTYSLAERINRLRLMGVCDVIVDPGFGFGKTLEDNYNLMAHLEELHMLECPLLVGVSRKSMIYNLLGATPEEALNGTTALHTIALMKGAHILRVHDVKAAVEAVKIVEQIKKT